jgi:hypothetical protein
VIEWANGRSQLKTEDASCRKLKNAAVTVEWWSWLPLAKLPGGVEPITKQVAHINLDVGEMTRHDIPS